MHEERPSGFSSEDKTSERQTGEYKTDENQQDITNILIRILLKLDF